MGVIGYSSMELVLIISTYADWLIRVGLDEPCHCRTMQTLDLQTRQKESKVKAKVMVMVMVMVMVVNSRT
ncbi:hypothetical protein A7D00_6845 [Trichophyton violaceum]|uniref:Uncharacterized protein n=1 Tax=Trichophyton violaceum TaxID=34388 RepID=A0A178FAX0_TRIVO|nr:hypothetical protein A7D00_6845 [Trichophyton violaceum]